MSAKRAVDISLSIAIVIIFLPVIIVLILITALILRENPFYIQRRGLSLYTGLFNLYKIKTIKSNGNLEKYEMDEILLRSGRNYHINSFGWFLRKTGMDEFPQLLNVIKGNMSLIGPRPLSVYDLTLIKKGLPSFNKKRAVLKVKPGISGYWQIYGKREEGLEQLINLDTYYTQYKSTKLDLALMVISAVAVFSSKHSDAILHDKKIITSNAKRKGKPVLENVN